MKSYSKLAMLLTVSSAMSILPITANAAVTNTNIYLNDTNQEIKINRDVDALGNIKFLIDDSSLANVKTGLNEVKDKNSLERKYFYTEDGKTLLVGKKVLDYREFNFDNTSGTTSGFTGQASDSTIVLQSGNTIHFSTMGAINTSEDIKAKFDKPVTPGWYKDNTNKDNKLHWYYTEDGTNLVLGEKLIQGSWYFLNPETGALEGNGWVNNGLYADKIKLGISHYYNDNGKRATGWLNTQNIWLHLNDAGLIDTGWKKINNCWYFLDPSTGIMKTGWHKDGNNWYYLDEVSGKTSSGWKMLNGNWYLFNNNGVMQTGWKKAGNTWYYLNNSGDMKTGWLKDGNNWYYLNSNGSMKTGWLESNGSWYFMKADGSMITSNFKLNGVVYTVNSSGVCSW